jgi:hypothetical protein
MDTNNDEKIARICSASIRKHSMDVASWLYTRLDAPHPEIASLVHLKNDELPIVSFFFSSASWYLLTSRRVIGQYFGCNVDISASDITQTSFGNFKGDGEKAIEVAIIATSNKLEARIEYETGKASMAPIYYFQFWSGKFPHLDVLE